MSDRPEQCRAVLKLGGCSVECQVIDLSREDFQVRVPKAKPRRFNVPRMSRSSIRMNVDFSPTEWHSQRQRYHLSSKNRRANQDETSVSLGSLFSSNMNSQTDPRFLMALMLAFILACLALPGLGDHLGTAPRLKNGIHSVIGSFK